MKSIDPVCGYPLSTIPPSKASLFDVFSRDAALMTTHTASLLAFWGI